MSAVTARLDPTRRGHRVRSRRSRAVIDPATGSITDIEGDPEVLVARG